MKNYIVTIQIDARYEEEIEANSPEEAIAMAKEAFFDADLGEIEIVDYSAPSVIER